MSKKVKDCIVRRIMYEVYLNDQCLGRSPYNNVGDLIKFLKRFKNSEQNKIIGFDCRKAIRILKKYHEVIRFIKNMNPSDFVKSRMFSFRDEKVFYNFFYNPEKESERKDGNEEEEFNKKALEIHNNNMKNKEYVRSHTSRIYEKKREELLEKSRESLDGALEHEKMAKALKKQVEELRR